MADAGEAHDRITIDEVNQHALYIRPRNNKSLRVLKQIRPRIDFTVLSFKADATSVLLSKKCDDRVIRIKRCWEPYRPERQSCIDRNAHSPYIVFENLPFIVI